nr:hypothetical protein CFP56_67826 [Quercus suber]
MGGATAPDMHWSVPRQQSRERRTNVGGSERSGDGLGGGAAIRRSVVEVMVNQESRQWGRVLSTLSPMAAIIHSWQNSHVIDSRTFFLRQQRSLLFYNFPLQRRLWNDSGILSR